MIGVRRKAMSTMLNITTMLNMKSIRMVDLMLNIEMISSIATMPIIQREMTGVYILRTTASIMADIKLICDRVSVYGVHPIVLSQCLETTQFVVWRCFCYVSKSRALSV